MPSGKALALMFIFWLCATAAIVAFVQQAPPADAPVRTQAYDRELSRAYVEAQCWQCHTVSTLSAQLERDFGPLAAGARAAGPDLAGIAGLYSDGWHAAHLWEPQMVAAGSQMPAQRNLFVLEGKAQTDNGRGVMRPAIKYSTQQVIEFMQSLDGGSPFRAPWPVGHKQLPEPGNVRQGQALFAQHCAGCHGASAEGNGEAAKFFAKPPANLKAAGMVWRTTKAPVPSYDDLFTTLTNGLPGSGMPSFARLGDGERASLVAFIAALNRETFDAYEPEFEKPLAYKPPRVNQQMLDRGRELYASARYQCANCHGNEGRGDGPLRADLITRYNAAPRNLQDERFRRGEIEGVFASLALGLGPAMPGVLMDDGSNADDLWALAAYARSLNRFKR